MREKAHTNAGRESWTGRIVGLGVVGLDRRHNRPAKGSRLLKPSRCFSLAMNSEKKTLSKGALRGHPDHLQVLQKIISKGQDRKLHLAFTQKAVLGVGGLYTLMSSF